MKLIQLIHNFQAYLKSERIRAEQAKTDGAYLVNAYTDRDFMKDLIKGTNKKIDIYTLDGVHIVISDGEKKKPSHKSIWNY